MVFGAVFLLLISSVRSSHQVNDFEQIKLLVTQWAPLIWLSPNEKYFPLNVESFLDNVHLADENGKFINATPAHFPYFDSKSSYLVTKNNLDSIRNEDYTFLNGYNPKKYSVPVYVIISHCTHHNLKTSRNNKTTLYKKGNPNLFFSVTYWTFYPYNFGKKICFIGKVPTFTIFGTCFGHRKTIGSHVGDWEHMSLSFKGKPFPSEMYLSVHNTGAYYKFDKYRNYFKFESQKLTKRIQVEEFPPIVRLQNGHPVVFSADGSHGLWSAPGDHEYMKLFHLVDKCGYGVPWKTWENLKIFGFGNDEFPKWLYFKGKWGNPPTNCVLSKKLGLCEHTEGPPGILRNKDDFPCIAS